MEDVNNGESSLDMPERHPSSSLLNKFSTMFVRDKTDAEETAVLTSFRPLSEEETHVRPLSYSLFDSDHDRLKESGSFYNSHRVSGTLSNPTREHVESWETGTYSKEQSVDEPSLSTHQEEDQFPSSQEGADPDLVEVTMVEVYSDTEQDEETGRSLNQSERHLGFQESLLHPPVVEEPVNDKSDQALETDSRCDDVIESNSSAERPVPSTAESLEEQSVKGSSVLDRARSKDTAADWGVQDLPVALRWNRRCSPVRREDIQEKSAEDSEHVSTEDMGSEVSAARARRRRQEASKLESEARERKETDQPEASEGDPLLVLSGTSAKLSLTNRKKASSAAPAGRNATDYGTAGDETSKARETEGRDGRGQELTTGLPDSADCQTGLGVSSGSSDTKGLSELREPVATEGASPADNEPSATSPRPQQEKDTPAASRSSIPLADQSPSSSSKSTATSPASHSSTHSPFSSGSGERSFQVPALFSGLRVFKKGALGEERETVSEIRQRDGDRALLSLKQHVNKAKLAPEQLATNGNSSLSPSVTRRRPAAKEAAESTGRGKEQASQLLEPEGDAKIGEQEEGGSDALPGDTEREGLSEDGTAAGDKTADAATANALEDSGAGGSAKTSETAFSLGAFKSFFTPKAAKKDGEETSVDVEAVRRKRRSEKELLKSIFERAGKSTGSDLKGITENKVCMKDVVLPEI